MRLLIGYDGSESAAAALDDLKLAGLPDKIDALIVTVAEMLLPPPISYGLVPRDFTDDTPFNVEQSTFTVSRAAQRLREEYPHWHIETKIRIGGAVQEILKLAEEWQPHLILLGAEGLSKVGRWLFGSVSQTVVTESNSSVRIVHERTREPNSAVRIIIGYDGSLESNAAVQAVATRHWPAGSEVRLITVIDHIIIDDLKDEGTAKEIIARLQDPAFCEKLRVKLQSTAVAELKHTGLQISSVIKAGNPKRIILHEAEEWQADNIFLGSRGLRRLKRLFLGSISSSVVPRAHCSVEVIHIKEHL